MPFVLDLLINVILMAGIFLAASWLFRLFFRRQFTMRGELLILAGITLVEIYIWQIVGFGGGSVNWWHVFYFSIPAFCIAAVIRWWINDAEE
ncbi:hypothetical protein CSC82_11705 [Rhodobacteraceae bacterium 4F10]|nr:hypothetical protein CSC82_11705 [Rhodobacteraceae bacterium 4F10]